MFAVNFSTVGTLKVFEKNDGYRCIFWTFLWYRGIQRYLFDFIIQNNPFGFHPFFHHWSFGVLLWSVRFLVFLSWFLLWGLLFNRFEGFSHSRIFGFASICGSGRIISVIKKVPINNAGIKPPSMFGEKRFEMEPTSKIPIKPLGCRKIAEINTPSLAHP